MKKTYKYIILAIICLASVIIEYIFLGILPLNEIVPYIAFCICSFVIIDNKNKVFSILMILLSSLVALPILNIFYSFVTSFIIYEFPFVLLGILFNFLYICIYYASFVIVNSLINKKKKVLTKTAYILIIIFTLIAAVITDLIATAALDQSLMQGSWFGVLSALNITRYSQLISSILFYFPLFFIAVKFVKKDQNF
ncbi:MAG: hypothetical protein IJE40_01935 [Clostridia bacterium]|nr:hypothetical protein [Clostridia bacterium]